MVSLTVISYYFHSSFFAFKLTRGNYLEDFRVYFQLYLNNKFLRSLNRVYKPERESLVCSEFLILAFNEKLRIILIITAG